MYNYLQKIFLIFLFFSVYAMENSKLIKLSSFEELYIEYLNIALSNANARIYSPIYSLVTYNKYAQDLQKIKEYIEKKEIDPNYKIGANGMPLIGLAVQYKNDYLVTYLINQNADVNQKNNTGCIPLKSAIGMNGTENLEIIRKLCQAGTSLIIEDDNITVFQHLANIEKPKEYLKTIITHARFDVYNQEVDEQLKKEVKTALLVFNRLTNDGKFSMPSEIKFRILSNLALNYFYGFNKKLCKKLVNMGFKDSLFRYLENRVENINKILKYEDSAGKTALMWWNDLYGLWLNYNVKEEQSLFDGSKLHNDMRDFKSLFPNNMIEIPKDNLIFNMHDNALKLLEK